MTNKRVVWVKWTRTVRSLVRKWPQYNITKLTKINTCEYNSACKYLNVVNCCLKCIMCSLNPGTRPVWVPTRRIVQDWKKRGTITVVTNEQSLLWRKQRLSQDRCRVTSYVDAWTQTIEHDNQNCEAEAFGVELSSCVQLQHQTPWTVMSASTRQQQIVFDVTLIFCCYNIVRYFDFDSEFVVNYRT